MYLEDVYKTEEAEHVERGKHEPSLSDSRMDSNKGQLVYNVQATDDYSDKVSWKVILAFIALEGQLNSYELTLLIPGALLSYINADLGPDPSYTWIAVCWSLGAAVLASIAGRLSDIFGRRYFMLLGSFLGFVGTIVGATGQNITQMIFSGVIFGISAGIRETFYACVMELVPNKKRTLFVGLTSFFGLPCLCSPLIAFAIMNRTNGNWRDCYWFMTAFEGVCGLFLFFFYHPPTFHTKHGSEKSKREMIKELDFVGLFLFTAGSVLFLVGINFGGRHYPWVSAATLCPLIIGVVLLVMFGLWEVYGSPTLPIMPPRLFLKVRSFVVLLIVCFAVGMLYYSFPVLWPAESSLLFIPASNYNLKGVYANLSAWGTWISGASVAFIFSRLRHERWQIFGCVVIQVALIGSLASVGVGDKSQAIATVLILSSFVNQPFYISFSVVSLGLDDQRDIGVATGVLSTIRLMGGAIGTAVYSTILANTYAPRLVKNVSKVIAETSFPKSDAPLLIKAAAANTAKAYEAVPGITKHVVYLTEMAVKQSYASAASVVWLTAVGLGGVAIISALFIQSVPASQKHSQRAVLLEDEKKPEKMTAKLNVQYGHEV